MYYIPFIAAFYITLAIVSYAISSSFDEEFTFARKAFEDKFYDLAKEKLENIVKEYPQKEEAIFLLGQTYFYLGKLDAALKEFGLLAEKNPPGNFLADATYWTGEARFKAGDYRAALNFYQKLIDNFPESSLFSYALYSKGCALFNLKEFDSAEEVFELVLKKFPKDRLTQDAQFKLAAVFYETKKLKEARHQLLLYLKNYPMTDRTKEAYYLLGEIAYQEADYRSAVEDYKKAVVKPVKEKWLPYAYYHLGMSYLNLSMPEEAKEGFRECLKISGEGPLKAEVKLAMAKTCYKLGNTAEAMALYKELIGMFKPEAGKGTAIEYEARYNLAWLYKELSRVEEAAWEFEIVKEGSKDKTLKVGSLCMLGDINFDNKKFDDALENYEEVLNNYSDSYYADYAQYQVGNVLLESERYDTAILAFQSLLVNFKNSKLLDEGRFKLAFTYYKKGDYPKAYQEFNALLKNFPQSSFGPTARFYAANSVYAMGRYDEAMRMFSDIASGGKDNEDLARKARYMTGWCYFQKGLEREAVSEFEKFLSMYPKIDLSPNVAFWLGEYFYHKRKFPEAKKYFQRVINEFSQSDVCDDSQYWLGLVYYEEGDMDTAKTQLQKVALDYPKSEFAGEALLKLADIFKEQNMIQEAYDVLNACIIKFQGTNFEKTAYRKVGNLLMENFLFDRAILYFRKALTDKRTELNAQIQFQIGEALQGKGDLEEAVVEYLKAAYFYPAAKFWVLRAQLKAAGCLEKLGRTDEAVKLYRKLSREDAEEANAAKRRLKELVPRH